jgi:flagellar biosynthetic protein FliP
LGALSAEALMIAAHVVMFPLMLAAMLWRRADYWHQAA